MRSCLFTPAVHFHGAQQSKNDLALWCCRNTSNNKTAKAAQRVWVHIELSKACCRHPIQGLQSNSFGPDSPFLMSLITDDKCSLHIEGFIYKQQFVNTSLQGWSLSTSLWSPVNQFQVFPWRIWQTLQTVCDCTESTQTSEQSMPREIKPFWKQLFSPVKGSAKDATDFNKSRIWESFP